LSFESKKNRLDPFRQSLGEEVIQKALKKITIIQERNMSFSEPDMQPSTSLQKRQRINPEIF
jgi:hypothetical protein